MSTPDRNKSAMGSLRRVTCGLGGRALSQHDDDAIPGRAQRAQATTFAVGSGAAASGSSSTVTRVTCMSTQEGRHRRYLAFGRALNRLEKRRIFSSPKCSKIFLHTQNLSAAASSEGRGIMAQLGLYALAAPARRVVRAASAAPRQNARNLWQW